MSYEIAEEMGVDVTYGWLIASVTSGGPADDAGLQGGTQQIQINNELVVVGGDIIIAINGARITSIYNISAYLEEYTLPGETINITIIRDNQTDTVALELESRPAATTAT
jgi:S1-C subfamily serine protease